MALRQTASNGANSNASTLVLTFGSSVQAGSLIVFAINTNSPITVTSITAGSGDTISYIANGLGSGQNFYFGYIQNTAGSYTTITINLSSTGWQVEAIAREYTNMRVASVLDQSAGATNSAATSWSSGAMSATTQAADLIVSAMGLANTPTTMTAGSGYGNLVTSNVETGYAASMEDQTVSSIGTYTGTMTSNVPGSGYMAVAAFKTNSMPYIVESVTTSETVKLSIITKATTSDSTTTSEAYSVTTINRVSVSDTTAISENVKLGIPLYITASESVTLVEAVVDLSAYYGPHAFIVDTVTTSEALSVGIHPYANMPLITAEYVSASGSVNVQIISAAGVLPYLQENVSTSETININTQTITGWSTKNAVLYQNTFLGPTSENASGTLTTMGGNLSYLYQQYTCTQSTQYVAQCEVKGISSTTVTVAAVQRGVVLSSNTVTMDGEWDTISISPFYTNPTDTTFQLQIYTQSAATINVGAVMTQKGVGALTTYFDGSTSASSSYIFSWSGTAQTSTSIATPVGSAVIEADFSDADGALPVTSVDTPIYNNPNLDSSYLTNYNEDASGDTGSSHIQLQSTTLNGSTYQMTFINTYTQPVYITQLTLYGTPAKVVYNINVEYKNPTSIALYGTNPTNNGQTLVISNDLIQDPSTALSDAYSIVNDYSNPYQRMTADVFPAYMLQIGDTVDITINDVGTTQAYTIVGITNGVGPDGAPQQSLEVEVKQLVHYFTINQSAIGGTDSIAP